MREGRSFWYNLNIVRFGPSGNDTSFYEQGFKSSVQAPAWLAKMELSAFEINFGRGIRMSPPTAKAIGEEAAKHNILISVHAPYFINLASENESIVQKSYGYIEKSLSLLRIMGGYNLVVHIGSQGELSREKAMENCKKNMKWVIQKLDDSAELKDFDYKLCIETMGRFSAIGNYKEICDICSIDSRIIPTLDFGHINCLMFGGLREMGEIDKIMDYCMHSLGFQKMKSVHIHFSPIKFGPKGELAHLDFKNAPEIFVPPFEPLAKYIKAADISPTIICESSERMAQDAVWLKKIFDKISKTYVNRL